MGASQWPALNHPLVACASLQSLRSPSENAGISGRTISRIRRTCHAYVVLRTGATLARRDQDK
eukprot:5295611-Alexandrium_andersonii.AAC.1